MIKILTVFPDNDAKFETLSSSDQLNTTYL